MTSRPNESSESNPCTRSDARPNQVTMNSQIEEEGCPVIEESGTVCGETRTLRIFQEFRQIYDDCLRKMESNREENLALRKLAPFRKLVEDLWEQNAMLVETVEELEQEATNRVAMLQTKLDQYSEKDLENLENLLRQKDREICCLTQDVSNKNELLGKYYNQIDELKRDMKARNSKHMQIIKRMRESVMQRLCQSPAELNADCEDFNESAIEILFNAVLREMDMQRTKLTKRIEESECLMNEMSHERNRVLNDKSDLTRRLEELRMENCGLQNELAGYKKIKAENEELLCRLEQVRGERDRLQEEVKCLNHNLQDLDSNFKKTRWALTAEVAEKHDQVLELKRTLVCLEEQVRQADMKTLFKDGVIKEMRKELKNSPTMVYAAENAKKSPLKIPPVAADAQSWRFDVPVKENSEEDIKLDIRIFPMTENQECLLSEYRSESCTLEVQTESKRKPLSKMRNVSTQHTTRVQKLPRSVGTLKVIPWSGAGGEGTACNMQSRLPTGHAKSHKGSYLPCNSQS